MSLTLRKPKTWPYASNSTGRLRGSLPLGSLGFRVQVYEALGDARRVYIDLSKDVVGHLNENAGEIRSSGSCVDLSLFMVGRSPERTKPMVMIVSEDKEARIEAFRLINKSGIMKKYPGFDLGHMPLKAEFENLQPLGGSEKAGPALSSSLPVAPSALGDSVQEDGVELAILTAGADSRMGGRRIQGQWSKCAGAQKETRSATVGGVVERNGKFYLHSVGHFLPSQNLFSVNASPATELEQDDEWDATGMSDFDEHDDEDDDHILVEATSRGSQTPDSIASDLSSESDILDSTSSKGGSESTSAALLLTDILDRLQRLRSDNSKLEPNPDESAELPTNDERRRDDSLSASTLPKPVQVGPVTLISDVHDSAFIHLSIGLAAQLGLSEPRLRQEAVPLHDFIKHIENMPKDAAVRTVTPYGGTIYGTLSDSPSYIRLPNATNFQEVYLAKMQRPLVIGDCGSWVRDATTGKVYGHVVAGSPTTGLTVIMPAINTFTHAREALQDIGFAETRDTETLVSDDRLGLSSYVGLGFTGSGERDVDGWQSHHTPLDFYVLPDALECDHEKWPHTMDMTNDKHFNRHVVCQLVLFSLVMNSTILSAAGPAFSLMLWAMGGVVVYSVLCCWVELGLSAPSYIPRRQTSQPQIGDKDKWFNLLDLIYNHPQRISQPRSGGDKNYLEYVKSRDGQLKKVANSLFKRHRLLLSCFYGLVFLTLGNMSGNALQFGLFAMAAVSPRDEPNDNRTAVIVVAIAALTAATFIRRGKRGSSIRLDNLCALLKVGVLVAMVVLGVTRYSGRISSHQHLSAGKPLCSALARAPGLEGETSSICHNRQSSTYIFGSSSFLTSPASPPFPTRCQQEHSMTAFDEARYFLQRAIPTQPDGDPTLRRAISALIAVFIFSNLLTVTYTVSRVKQGLAKEGIVPSAHWGHGNWAKAVPTAIDIWRSWRLSQTNTAIFRWLADVALILLVGSKVEFHTEDDARVFIFTGILDALIRLETLIRLSLVSGTFSFMWCSSLYLEFKRDIASSEFGTPLWTWALSCSPASISCLLAGSVSCMSAITTWFTVWKGKWALTTKRLPFVDVDESSFAIQRAEFMNVSWEGKSDTSVVTEK
ncbi:hypothetical protein B0H63DRAFT_474473 [Podospora didyma]|uniref:Uncharacterized protein n=1 Tax=Podospora didyma TaxID=330526 RepID=A0AAE0NG01_9PEZI|nr:hypothetical protein B0H63DRAFT_474473 [Podospora didyma]